MIIGKTGMVNTSRVLSFLIPVLLFLSAINANAQNVGIGTTTPRARLHVTDSSVVFSGNGLVSLPADDPPISGPGKRMMWYAGKAAFRAGYVQNTEWDNTRIGPYSFAAGFNPVASATTSFSLGYQTIASANYSIALGVQTIASGEYTTAMGAYSVASGPGSSTLGLGNIAKGYCSTVVGMFNDSILTSNDIFISPTTPLFVVGNGNFESARSNAMTVLKNGNVGIGLSSPQAKLDIRGNFRSGGLNNYLLYDSLSGQFNWSNSYIWATGPQYIMKHSASSEGLYYGNSQIEYRYQDGTPRFFTNWNTGNGYFYGNLGIGIINPPEKLHVGSGTVRIDGPVSPGGNALSIGGYGDLQVDASGIPGGRFTVKENGNVGIGVSNPAYKLDVAQRMRLRSGGNNTISAGIWMNNNSNTEAAFVGMEDNTHIGLFGNNGAGWQFSMNTQTGALKISGSEGAAGQLLQSNGSGASPSWTNKPSVLSFNQTNVIVLGGSDLCVDIPGISNQNFTLSQNSSITYYYSVGLFGDNGVGGYSNGVLSIEVLNGSSNVVSSGVSAFNVGNYQASQVIVVGTGTLNAGTYSIRARAARQNTGEGTTRSQPGTAASCGINYSPGQLIIQTFPN